MFIKLCATTEVSPGEMKQFDLKEEESLSRKSEWAALLPGRAGALTQVLPSTKEPWRANVLTCPWHYSQFNIKMVRF